MSEEAQTEDEPSIEEILDSIRQIISEDDEGEEVTNDPEVEVTPEPVEDPIAEVDKLEPAPEPKVTEELDQSAIDDMDFDTPTPDPIEEEIIPDPEPKPDDDVLELTDIVNTEDNRIKVALKETEEDVAPEVDKEPILEPDPTPEPDVKEVIAPVLTANPEDSLLTTAAEAAAVTAVTAITELVRKTAVERSGVTLEDIVRAELKPLLRDWLDKHLPTVIERLVQEELERVSNRVLDE